MNGLISVFHMIWQAERKALLRGAVLSLLVLLAGVALLGLSGWFIAAAATAGLAGLGAAFDFARPGQWVRVLAMGRSAARYGERLLTHDATLRAVTQLRVAVLQSHLRLPFAQAIRLRTGLALNRLTRDMDLLDQLPIRIVFPTLAGITSLIVIAAVLSWVTQPLLGLGIVLIQALGIGVSAALAMDAGMTKGVKAEQTAQDYRRALSEVLRHREDLTVLGRLGQRLQALKWLDSRGRRTTRAMIRAERKSNAILGATGLLALAFAIGAGTYLYNVGAVTAAQVAIGVFATLAMAELAAPFTRAFAELGRVEAAATRLVDLLEGPEDDEATAATHHHTPRCGRSDLSLEHITYRHPGAMLPLVSNFNLQVVGGETVALCGASGSGKSTILSLAAGLIDPDHGGVRLGETGIEHLAPDSLRRDIGMLPQRSALLAGSVRDNLLLSAPDLSDSAAWAALDAAGISETLRRRQGLDTRIGEGGKGFSGGEQRRIALARVLVRQPRVLLLDEPTEGLPRETALKVLAGIRDLLPEAAILTASHRSAELDWADRVVTFR